MVGVIKIPLEKEQSLFGTLEFIWQATEVNYRYDESLGDVITTYRTTKLLIRPKLIFGRKCLHMMKNISAIALKAQFTETRCNGYLPVLRERSNFSHDRP